jgi:hypothetical protein
MQTSLLYVLGIIVVAALGAGAFFMTRGTSGMQATSTPQDMQQAQSTSLIALLTSPNPQRCTFSSSTANATSSGTVYTANGQMRGDFTSFSQGKTIESHMIVHSGTSYVWSDALPSGYKMAFNASSSAQSMQSVMADPNAQIDYSCAPWSADPTLFTLPAAIEFRDIEAAGAASAGASSAQSMHGAQCTACDNAPDASTRAQCRAALAC